MCSLTYTTKQIMKTNQNLWLFNAKFDSCFLVITFHDMLWFVRIEKLISYYIIKTAPAIASYMKYRVTGMHTNLLPPDSMYNLDFICTFNHINDFLMVQCNQKSHEYWYTWCSEKILELISGQICMWDNVRQDNVFSRNWGTCYIALIYYYFSCSSICWSLSGMSLLSVYVICMPYYLFSYLLLLLSVYAVNRSYFLFSYLLVLLSVYTVNYPYFLFSYLLVYVGPWGPDWVGMEILLDLS